MELPNPISPRVQQPPIISWEEQLHDHNQKIEEYLQNRVFRGCTYESTVSGMNRRMSRLWNVDDQAARLAELTSQDPNLKEAPLRRDVRSLGRLLGEVLKEQAGDKLFSAVEELRLLLIEHRELRAQPGHDLENERRLSERASLVF